MKGKARRGAHGRPQSSLSSLYPERAAEPRSGKSIYNKESSRSISWGPNAGRKKPEERLTGSRPYARGYSSSYQRPQPVVRLAISGYGCKNRDRCWGYNGRNDLNTRPARTVSARASLTL